MTDRATSDYWPLPFAPLQALLDYWLAKRGPRRCPDKAEIDPTEIGTLLPHVILLDAAPDGGAFRYRLAGLARAAPARDAGGCRHHRIGA